MGDCVHQLNATPSFVLCVYTNERMNANDIPNEREIREKKRRIHSFQFVFCPFTCGTIKRLSRSIKSTLDFFSFTYVVCCCVFFFASGDGDLALSATLLTAVSWYLSSIFFTVVARIPFFASNIRVWQSCGKWLALLLFIGSCHLS